MPFPKLVHNVKHLESAEIQTGISAILIDQLFKQDATDWSASFLLCLARCQRISFCTSFGKGIYTITLSLSVISDLCARFSLQLLTLEGK
jgi:hypothetical protein